MGSPDMVQEGKHLFLRSTTEWANIFFCTNVRVSWPLGMNGWKADPAGEECEISTTRYHCPAVKAAQLADVSDVPAASIFAVKSCTKLHIENDLTGSLLKKHK